MSRSTSINEMSNGVSGTFLLRDLLSITTKSGSINITVIPQPASSSGAPAELLLNTASGSINVTMAPFLQDSSAVIHERVFNTSIKTMSGRIDAALVHNHKTSLSTMSGNINTLLFPLGRPDSSSSIDLCCHSGFACMNLRPYINSPKSSIRTLSMDVRGGSGALRLLVPSTWEGEVISQSTSGNVKHDWHGLRVLTNGPRFTATKGNGLGQLNIWGSSMNVELIGEHMSGFSGLSIQGQVKEEGEGMPVAPALPSEVHGKEEGQRLPNLARKHEWRTEEDDDDWTIVGDEDGGEEITRRPPPTYNETTRR